MEQIISNLSLLVEYPVFNVDKILQGLMIGGIFVLAAYGLALVWGVMNVKNLAQGDFVIFGGYLTWWMANLGIPLVLAVPLTVVALVLICGGLSGTAVDHFFRRHWRISLLVSGVAFVMFAIGLLSTSSGSIFSGLAGSAWWMQFVGSVALTVIFVGAGGIYGLIISRVIERDLFTSLLATFGIGIIMAQLMNLLFGSDTQTLRLDYDSLSFADGIVQVPIAKLMGAVLAALLAAAVIVFMRRSRMGQAIRATAQDARAARVLGIDTERVYAFTFSLNAAICGAAGSIVVMVWEIQPFYGITYAVRSFVIVTAAGLGNLPGVITAGYGLGVLEQYGAHIFGIGYQQAIVVLLLLFVLFYRLMQQRRNRQVLQ